MLTGRVIQLLLKPEWTSLNAMSLTTKTGMPVSTPKYLFFSWLPSYKFLLLQSIIMHTYGGSLDTFTYEWVVLGSVLFQTGQINLLG